MEKKRKTIGNGIDLDDLRVGLCSELTRKAFVGEKVYNGVAVTTNMLLSIKAAARRDPFPPEKRKIRLKVNDDNVMIEIDCVLEKGEIVDFYLVEKGVRLSSGRFERESGAYGPPITEAIRARSEEIGRTLGWEDIMKAGKNEPLINSLVLPLVEKASDIFSEPINVDLLTWTELQKLEVKALPEQGYSGEYALLPLSFKGETVFIVVVTDESYKEIVDIWRT